MTEQGIEAAAQRPYLAWLSGLMAATVIALALSGCNTMRGAGEDVSAAGGAMSEGAQDVEDEID